MKKKNILKLFFVMILSVCLTVTSAAPTMALDTASATESSDTTELSDETESSDVAESSDATESSDASASSDATESSSDVSEETDTDNDATDGTSSDSDTTDSSSSDAGSSEDSSSDPENTDDTSSDAENEEETAAQIDLSSASVSLSKSSYSYTGSSIKPAVTVKLSGTKLNEGTDYTVSYSKNKSIGTASITITGTGNYTGTAKKTFQIIPAKVTINSAAWSASTSLTIKWAKVSGSVTKYQIRYRTKGSSTWTTKTISSSKTSCTLKNLTSSKQYQVQVRAYKTVSDTRYYGSWSSVKTVKSRFDRTVKINGSNTTLHHTSGTWSKKNGYKYYTIKSTGKKAKKTFLNIKGSIYYFDSKGRMYTSWHKIGSDYYFFNRSSGKLAMGTTVDKMKVTKYGVLKNKSSYIKRVKVIISAREFMEDNTAATDSKSAKLKKCFKALFPYPYKQYRKLKNIYNDADWELTFANDIFIRGQGCCVSTSCALAFIARECGYTDVYIAHDSGHAWVMINGYVYDNLFAEARGWSGNYHGSKKGDYRTNPPYKRTI